MARGFSRSWRSSTNSSARIGGLGERLHAEAVRVAVDDQPGEEVALAVNDALRALPLRIGSRRVSQRDGLLEPPAEEGVVDGLVLAAEHPHRDLAARAVEALADEPAALVGQPHHFAAG